MDRTLAERIHDSIGTGREITELTVLDTFDNVTASADEINYLDITTLGTGAASKAVVLDGNGDYTFPATATIVMPSGGTINYQSGSTFTMSGSFLCAPVAIPDATPYTVLLANSGKPHKILEQTASITLNLPAVTTAGQKFKFEMGGVATEAQNWVFVAAAGAFLTGGVLWGDLNAGAASDELGVLYCNGSSHLTLTYVTPAAGSWVEFISNGTIWYVNGQVISDSTPTIA